ncbi:MAG: O-antigen ligase family protein [Vicinamibacterales bacterium]
MSATSIPANGVLSRRDNTGLRGAHAAPLLDKITVLLLLGFVAAVQVSIVVAQALLAATVLCWVVQLARDREWPAVPALFWPLVAYAAASILSVAFSADFVTSFQPIKKLLLFVAVPLVYNLARGRRASTVVDVILSVGAVTAALGIVQYGILEYDFLGQRPHGSLGHYMTYSGLLMLVVCAAVARLVFGHRNRTWPALIMPALIVALAVTFTRSAWVGACIGVSLLFVLRDFRLVGAIPIVVALFFAAAPNGIAQRMASTFDLKDPTNRDRVAMVKMGVAIVKDHPLTGVGPNMIERVYPQYRQPDAVKAVNVHLHNVPVQIAAERGLLALAAWVWLVVSLMTSLVRVFRTHPDRTLAATGLAAVAAMLAAGLFEHNFGDSEFLMLFLVLVTVPFAALRQESTVRT